MCTKYKRGSQVRGKCKHLLLMKNPKEKIDLNTQSIRTDILQKYINLISSILQMHKSVEIDVTYSITMTSHVTPFLPAWY